MKKLAQFMILLALAVFTVGCAPKAAEDTSGVSEPVVESVDDMGAEDGDATETEDADADTDTEGAE